MSAFLDALDRRVLICDGAMGTMLYSRGIFLNRSFDELNLSQPDLVTEVHQTYVRAGADVIETNTFGANRVKLAAFGLGERVHAINVQGAKLARHAAREHAFVAGAIGPLGVRVEPWGKVGLDEAQAWFTEQAAALTEGGIDLFILETFRDVSELGAAVRAVRSVSDRPVVAQLTTGEDGNTLDGIPPEDFASQLEAFGVDVIGLNCGVGPATMLDTIERLAGVSKARLSAQPNAGRPRDVEGRNIYLCSPEYMASYARRFALAGAKLVGGCCGTTPEHIRQIRQVVRTLEPSAPRAVHAKPGTGRPSAPAPGVARAEKSQLASALAGGRFVTTVRLALPRGAGCDAAIASARTARANHVDAVVIPDVGRSAARISPLAVAVLVQQQAQIESVLYYSCRDHSLLGMQTDLLGAHAMGVRNLIIVTGEAVSRGDYPDATAVYDVDSIGLTNVVARLNHGQDIGGQSIGQPTAFHLGVEVDAAAVNRDEELRRFKFKVDAGAEFAVTRPVFDADELRRFLEVLEPFGLPVIVGIRPLTGLREAEFFANEEPGMLVASSLLDRLRAADQIGEGRAEGRRLARELFEDVRHLAQGIQVSGRPEDVETFLAELQGRSA
ncbi:MAG: bifunctional homocysteine S-methyltransferase/methylenetetrahydrofolate reductase [Vicinamibacterales bacterium]